EFVRGITECTIHFNTAIPPQYRAIVIVSVAQAALESSWGESRFARLGNNFYGMIETDKSKPHIKALNSDIILRKYNRKCESVADYITLLNTGTQFIEYRKVRNKETVTQEVNLDEIINTLHTFALDKDYTNKIKKTVDYLLKEYPEIFLIVKGQDV
ncbi:MAG: putative mannosyl-glycoprotein endo-beta-N-acetylglucosaminidase, partial [Prokaryotic dsDNA virus sp.]